MTALPVAACPTEAELEFDRQVDALAMTGLPEALDLAESASAPSVEPLRDLLPAPEPDGTAIPFVVVVPHLPVVPVLESVHTVGGSGFTTMDDDDLARFRPLPELQVPAGPYLLLDVDPGRGHPEPAARRGAPPADRGRPLPAHDRRGRGRARLRSRGAARPQLLLAAGLAGGRQARPRAVGQRPPAAAGLVLPGRARTPGSAPPPAPAGSVSGRSR